MGAEKSTIPEDAIIIDVIEIVRYVSDENPHGSTIGITLSPDITSYDAYAMAGLLTNSIGSIFASQDIVDNGDDQ